MTGFAAQARFAGADDRAGPALSFDDPADAGGSAETDGVHDGGISALAGNGGDAPGAAAGFPAIAAGDAPPLCLAASTEPVTSAGAAANLAFLAR